MGRLPECESWARREAPALAEQPGEPWKTPGVDWSDLPAESWRRPTEMRWYAGRDAYRSEVLTATWEHGRAPLSLPRLLEVLGLRHTVVSETQRAHARAFPAAAGGLALGDARLLPGWEFAVECWRSGTAGTARTTSHQGPEPDDAIGYFVEAARGELRLPWVAIAHAIGAFRLEPGWPKPDREDFYHAGGADGGTGAAWRLKKSVQRMQLRRLQGALISAVRAGLAGVSARAAALAELNARLIEAGRALTERLASAVSNSSH